MLLTPFLSTNGFYLLDGYSIKITANLCGENLNYFHLMFVGNGIF